MFLLSELFLLFYELKSKSFFPLIFLVDKEGCLVLLNLLDYFDPKQQYPSFPPFVTFSTEKQSQI
jgi:hypothetical protein